MTDREELLKALEDITQIMYGSSLNHPDVLVSSGGGGCPVQYYGFLHNGLRFYFRYRGGHASVCLFAKDANEGHYLWYEPECVGYGGVEFGHPLDGFFDTDEDRDTIFAECLTKALESMNDEEFHAEQVEMQRKYPRD